MPTRHPFIVMILIAVTSSAVLRAAEKFENYTQTIPGTLVKFEMVAMPAGTIDLPDDLPKDRQELLPPPRPATRGRARR